jgi:hypothetical protein
MQDSQKLGLLLTQLGTRYGISNLKLPAHGAVGLRLKDGSELYLVHDDAQSRLYVYMPVIALPGADDERLRLFGRLLQLNFLGADAEDCVLSVERELVMCHISFRIGQLRFETLDRSLQTLISHRTQLIEKLKSNVLEDGRKKTSKARHSASQLLASLK